MAVPPNLVGFVESAGLAAVAYGPDSQEQLNTDFVRNFWTIQNPITVVRAAAEHLTQGWAEMSRTLTSLADGADLILTGALYQAVAANVAEYYDIPMVALHCFPLRTNGQLIPKLPAPVIRATISAIWWLHGRMTKDAEDAQRRELGLPQTSTPLERRIVERGYVEIQAYEELCFPGLAAEWSKWEKRRPFVGALTMELPTNSDDEVASWIAAGTPPIAFCFGSMPIESPAETVTMIGKACAQLGERALLCSGASDFTHAPQYSHVKVVGLVNYAAIFPTCRAVVHHGGAGTTALGMRAGVPMLILWLGTDQPIWAAMLRKLKVGAARRFSRTTPESLVADLRKILTPRYTSRAREIAARMTKPEASVTAAAGLVENIACGNSAG
ncbi:putative glycosyltransferase [Mycobacterium botniense]|uniref:Putative glycosyltransferase n=2 Tax=Mycobacterium botniense TaxID=84962 RepID=A0A7I9Y1Y0_9MYCO|nr:putative glycosyltransferase [Mycobacterium botniense]